MTDKCTFCDNPALFIYNGEPICIDCYEEIAESEDVSDGD